jgi:hypothetical protein
MKMPQQKITQTIDVVQWTLSGDDAEAAAETRKRARQCGPAAVAFLYHLLITDNLANIAQRLRAASTLLEAGGFLAFENKDTGMNFHTPGPPGDCEPRDEFSGGMGQR